MSPPVVVHLLGSLNRGGAETVALDLCRAIPAAEITQVFWLLGDEVGSLAPEFEAAGAVVEQLPLSPFPVFVPRYWRKLRALRPDAVVSHVSLVSGLMLLIARVAGVPRRIARMHSMGDGRPNSPRRRLQRAVLRRMLRAGATDVAGVTWAALDFAGLRRGDPRGRVLPNGVDVTRFAGARLAQTTGAAAPVLMHVGRAAPEKNRGFLLDVLRQVHRTAPGARLVFVGPGGTADLEAVDPRIGTNPAVEVAGPTDRVEDFLARADVLLLPSHWEGQPGVVLEALAAGVPVVANDLPGVREIAETCPGISIVPLSAGPTAWAQAALSAASVDLDRRRFICAAMCDSTYRLERSVELWRQAWLPEGIPV
jgi:glycosyltransferase involved in cell wall biosynthesis